MVEFATGFGTAPPATDSSEAGPRGEEGFYRHFGTGIPPSSTSEASQCGEEGLPTYPSARGPSTEPPHRWLCVAKEPFLE